MNMPTRNSDPYVPVRASGWPVHRTPRWLFLAATALLACAVVVGLAVHPSRSQRAADMNGFLKDVTTGIESCSGGVRESFQVLRAIQTGANHDLATAIHVATYGAANCSPANNTQLGDLAQYQVHESLASFHLNRAVDAVLTWAFPDAQRVQNDVAEVLRTQGAARAAATVTLDRDLGVLNAQRAAIYGMIRPAVQATGATAKLPPLYG